MRRSMLLGTDWLGKNYGLALDLGRPRPAKLSHHVNCLRGFPHCNPSLLRLALPLAGPAGLIDLDRDGKRFRAAAIAGAAHRGCAEIVEADGDAGMGVGGADAVGGVDPGPAKIRHKRFRPGVPCLLIDDAIRAY